MLSVDKASNTEEPSMHNRYSLKRAFVKSVSETILSTNNLRVGCNIPVFKWVQRILWQNLAMNMEEIQ